MMDEARVEFKGFDDGKEIAYGNIVPFRDVVVMTWNEHHDEERLSGCPEWEMHVVVGFMREKDGSRFRMAQFCAIDPKQLLPGEADGYLRSRGYADTGVMVLDEHMKFWKTGELHVAKP
jgi:hypothetical protein